MGHTPGGAIGNRVSDRVRVPGDEPLVVASRGGKMIFAGTGGHPLKGPDHYFSQATPSLSRSLNALSWYALVDTAGLFFAAPLARRSCAPTLMTPPR